MWILIVALVCYLLWIWIVKPYTMKQDNILLFTGGLGSGKSVFSTAKASFLYGRCLATWRWRKFKAKIKRQPVPERPRLYSNIPLQYRKGKYAHQLTEDILLGHVRIPPLSVCHIDEVATWLSQMAIRNPNLSDAEIFASLYRHFTLGGYLVMNTQSSNKINFVYRYCANSCYNLMYFRHFWKIYWVRVRNINISDDVKQIDENTVTEKDMRRTFGMFPLRYRRYDTYAFSDLYPAVDPDRSEPWHPNNGMKADHFLHCPDYKYYYVPKEDQDKKEPFLKVGDDPDA